MAGGGAGAVIGRGGQMKLLVVRRYGVTVINALLDFRCEFRRGTSTSGCGSNGIHEAIARLWYIRVVLPASGRADAYFSVD